jgi:hypothetical protein
MRTTTRGGLPAVAVLAALMLLCSLGVARAGTIIVTTTADPGGRCTRSGCSLRSAINVAAANDIINFAIPATDPGCTRGGCKIVLDASSGPLLIPTAMTIDGSAQHITLAGPGSIQLLVNSSSGLVLNALTFSGGYCLDTTGIGGTARCYAGGAIYNFGVLTVTNSTFSGNSGGESCFSHHSGCGGADALSGGALANAGTTVISGSTFVSNTVNPGAEGAAIASFSGNVTVTNSTFSGNSGNSTLFNGYSDCCDAYSGQAGNVTLINSTFSASAGAAVANQIAAPGGTAGTVTLSNTVLAGSTGGSCLTDPGHYAAVTDGGGNVADDTTCAFMLPSSQSATNPDLGPLQNNGGPTPTLELLAGSAAAATGVAANCPVTDQRGVARPGAGRNCSSGAFQYVALSCPAGSALAGVPYGSALTVAGGIAPYTFSIGVGALPPGLNLDPATGGISGTPVTAGPYVFSGQVTDSAQAPASAAVACALTVVQPLLRLSARPLSVSFGRVLLSSGALVSAITVGNTGSAPVAIASVTIVPGSRGSNLEFRAASLCPASLGVQQSCRIEVSFVPHSPGTQSATLLITSNAQGSPLTIPLNAVVIGK